MNNDDLFNLGLAITVIGLVIYLLFFLGSFALAFRLRLMIPPTTPIKPITRAIIP